MKRGTAASRARAKRRKEVGRLLSNGVPFHRALKLAATPSRVLKRERAKKKSRTSALDGRSEARPRKQMFRPFEWSAAKKETAEFYSGLTAVADAMTAVGALAVFLGAGAGVLGFWLWLSTSVSGRSLPGYSAGLNDGSRDR